MASPRSRRAIRAGREPHHHNNALNGVIHHFITRKTRNQWQTSRASADYTMAGSRGVRAGSRRKTPTPQLEKAPAPARASRRLRSASRDFEPIPEMQKPTRRSTRQESVARSESEIEGLKPRGTKKKPAKEAATGWSALEP
jgi:hypothetical protein